MKIAIIVDDLDPDRRRRCFWEEQLTQLQDVEYELVSLLQKMEERKFFDVYAYDVVIFNWCVLDGALMYASDRVQCIVEFYDDHFRQFVRKGGVLIMENQPKRWRPSQKAYDVLLQGEVFVTSRESYLFGSKVVVNRRLKRHPLFQHLPDTLYGAYSHPHNESWFPPGSTSAKSINELQPTKVYSGAFESWKSEWLPTLYTDDGRYPVMLLRTEGLGLWVVTTMYIASSNIQELVESLIIGSRRNALAVQEFHAHQRVARAWDIARASAVVLLFAAAVYGLLVSRLITADIPYGNTVLGNAVFSILLAAVLSSVTFLRKYVWRMFRAARNK